MSAAMAPSRQEERLAQVIKRLGAQWGALRVQEPNAATGTIRIVVANTGRSWKLTVEGRLIAEPPSKWGKGGRRS